MRRCRNSNIVDVHVYVVYVIVYYAIYRHGNNNNNCYFVITYSSCVHIICSSDIDECDEGTSHCQQTCTNTNGSFECSCVNGYTLNMADNKTCIIGKSPDIRCTCKWTSIYSVQVSAILVKRYSWKTCIASTPMEVLIWTWDHKIGFLSARVQLHC